MYLLIYQQTNGEWDVAIMRTEHLHQGELTDVLGRSIPDYVRFKFYDGIEKQQASRLAKSLKGLSRFNRVEQAEKLSKQLKIKAHSNSELSVVSTSLASNQISSSPEGKGSPGPHGNP